MLDKEIVTILDTLKEKYPQIQLDWINSQWRVSLFDKDCHWKDESYAENILDALKELVKE